MNSVNYSKYSKSRRKSRDNLLSLPIRKGLISLAMVLLVTQNIAPTQVHFLWMTAEVPLILLLFLIVMGMGALLSLAPYRFLEPDIFPHIMLHEGRVAIYFEAAVVIIVLVLLGQMLELRARSRSGFSTSSRDHPTGALNHCAVEIVLQHVINAETARNNSCFWKNLSQKQELLLTAWIVHQLSSHYGHGIEIA